MIRFSDCYLVNIMEMMLHRVDVRKVQKHLAECLVHGHSLINVTPSTCHPFTVRFKSENCMLLLLLLSHFSCV